ncbi:MAG TPA: branched-chain amino acid ABC transporter permease [Anaerolineales bacterium]|nr:branched-chain amino acid ABC transporter permease [Anaerolineales bacterium]
MQWVNIVAQGILLGGLYALYGTGLSLIFGVMRLVNLAHGDMIVVAAYLVLLAGQFLGLSPWLSLLLVVPALFVIGVLLQRGLINAAVGKGVLPPLMITFGLSVITQNVLQLGFSADTQGLDAGPIEAASIEVAQGVTLGVLPLIAFATAVLVLTGLHVFLTRTKLGRAFRATSDDPTTAELMGINSRQVYGWAMGLSLAIGAVGGVLLGVRTTFAPSDGPARLIFAFETVIIGGLGNLWGTLAGGIILGVAQNIGAQVNPAWFQLAGHLATLALLAFRPTGLFARTREAG